MGCVTHEHHYRAFSSAWGWTIYCPGCGDFAEQQRGGPLNLKFRRIEQELLLLQRIDWRKHHEPHLEAIR